MISDEEFKAKFIAKRANERLMQVLRSMKSRCENPNNSMYKYYGGRGIRVCAEWQDVDKFKSWALANGYDIYASRHQCTIDRIDNDKGYSPENCQFLTISDHAKKSWRDRMATRNEMDYCEMVAEEGLSAINSYDPGDRLDNVPDERTGIGKVIREKRLERNMTQKELGLLLGYGEDSAQVRVSNFESGQKAPRKKIKKISELLDIPIELLID